MLQTFWVVFTQNGTHLLYLHQPVKDFFYAQEYPWENSFRSPIDFRQACKNLTKDEFFIAIGSTGDDWTDAPFISVIGSGKFD